MLELAPLRELWPLDDFDLIACFRSKGDILSALRPQLLENKNPFAACRGAIGLQEGAQ
jgi:hypothetical protein